MKTNYLLYYLAWWCKDSMQMWVKEPRISEYNFLPKIWLITHKSCAIRPWQCPKSVLERTGQTGLGIQQISAPHEPHLILWLQGTVVELDFYSETVSLPVKLYATELCITGHWPKCIGYRNCAPLRGPFKVTIPRKLSEGHKLCSCA